MNLKMSHSFKAAAESMVDHSDVRNAESRWSSEFTACAHGSSSTREKDDGCRFLYK